ncbi:MAG: hypothetical protein QM605_06180 [Sphingobium sp.]
MAKYDALRDYLKESGAQRLRIPLFFVEQMVGALPSSAYRRSEWWANEDADHTRHVQCKAWRDAGYRAQFDQAGRAVTFVSESGAGEPQAAIA